MSTKRAFLSGGFVHVIQVFIESAVSGDELGSSSVVFSVGYKSIKDLLRLLIILVWLGPKIILVCLGQSLLTISVLSLFTLSFISLLICD